MSPQQPSRSELRDAIAKLKPYLRTAAVFSLISSLLILAPSAYMLEVYDRVVNSQSHTTLLMLTLLVIGAYGVMEILDWARYTVMNEAGKAFDQAMVHRVFDLTFAANLQRVPGGTVQTMSDFRTVRDFLSSPVLLTTMELPVALVFLVLIFYMNPLLGWVALAGAVVQTLVAWINERSTRPPLQAANMASMAAQHHTDGTLRNAQVIESMGMLKNIHKTLMKKQHDVLKLQALASDRAAGFNAFSKFWQLTISSALLGVGCLLLLEGSLQNGAAMMVASILGGRVLAPMVQIVGQWQLVENALAAWKRLDKLLEQIPPAQQGMPLPAPLGRLTVENLSAVAPNSQSAILRGVGFRLDPGEVLAVIGPSASGKTTLARMLTGVWPAYSGKVRLDGADVYRWNKSELGPHVGYLPQEAQLFEGTIAENIARFGDSDMKKITAAAQTVGLHEFIMGLEQGYESPVGRDGAILSGGQRQRVALARALYGDPVFVVLDEPNANLDETGDAALANALRTVKARGTTFVVMTHRTSVLDLCDKVLILMDGQVQAFGPRDEVLASLKKGAGARNETPPPKAPLMLRPS